MPQHPAGLSSRAIVSALILCCSSLLASASYAQAGAAAATYVALDDASSLVSSKIAEAKDAGKEVELEFYKTLMQSLDRARDLMREATGEIDKTADNSLRKGSTELRALLKGVNDISQSRMHEVMITTNSINQAIADVPGVKDRRIVTMVWPTVIKQRRAGELSIAVLGVGLADCDSVTLKLNGKEYEPTTNIGNSVEFTVPYSVFSHSNPGQKTFQGTIVLDPGWFSWDIEVPVGFKVLPDKIASYVLSPQLGVTVREYSEVLKVPFTKLSGRDGRRSVSVKPSHADWRIDTSSIRVKKLGGEKSSDMRFEGLPTELGFVIYSDMGHIKKRFSKKPGWATFSYSWREFKDAPEIQAGAALEGDITVLGGAVSYTLAKGTDHITGTLTDFTGKSFGISPGRATYGWVRVDHVKASNTVIIEADL
jgi:hypothetical protein